MTTTTVDPTERVLRYLASLTALRKQDRWHSGRMDLHREAADDLLDELLVLHPEMRAP